MPPLARTPELDAEMDLTDACNAIGCTPDDLIAELQRRAAAKAVKMRAEMTLAAKNGATRRIIRDKDLGDIRVSYMVHPVSYHFWGQELGYECWDDAQFVREYLRDNPECRIKEERSGPVNIGFAATRPAPKNVTPAKGAILDSTGRAMSPA
ncbi:MAG: hypothetical protein H7Y06_13015 [Opitutaceae bacterium]|nr:hypothetical protein [Opitutaceae bacterium]